MMVYCSDQITIQSFKQQLTLSCSFSKKGKFSSFGRPVHQSAGNSTLCSSPHRYRSSSTYPKLKGGISFVAIAQYTVTDNAGQGLDPGDSTTRALPYCSRCSLQGVR